MKIVFLLNFHTVPGQSIWLRLATIAGGMRLEQTLPLRWINERQWQGEIEAAASAAPLRLEYSYQFRQEDNEVCLDEWNGPRTAEVDASLEVLCLRDTWCSAGTVDYALETDAFRPA
jgi:4-alpha-glucanotransferase